MIENPEKTFGKIESIVAKSYGVQKNDMHGNRKWQPLCEARQVAMALCYQLSRLSSHEMVARYFNLRRHSSVVQAVQRCDELVSVYPEVAAIVNKVKEEISK